ncbi:GTP 3',8-cyclase MoaA [Ponticaulis profundi]|uniref:GTP 3',8-cyclase n=1 Tax=Ponticaulis profundi TaxID=2665222 RepID=A0ABW1SEN3_9PROT
MADGSHANFSGLTDQFGRRISYLRLSVTDRCDLRCTYCMSEKMSFLPKSEVLSETELFTVARAFVARGVHKIRITGGEPLVRKDIMSLFERLSTLRAMGLDELTLTTNATLLDRYASQLYDCGVRRVNISLDSINPQTFRTISRRDQLGTVMKGILAAQQAGLSVKLNMVVMKGRNDLEVPELVQWAHSRGIEVTLIEVMPMGETGESRFDQYVPLTDIRDRLEEIWTLEDEIPRDALGGPARYVRIRETGGRLGFITPLTNNFCAGCNRVRVTCTGRIYMCLGQEDHVDLRAALRSSDDPFEALNLALDKAMLRKPEGHDFEIGRGQREEAVARHMSVTGG